MIELLALGSAVLYGSADFFGGLTARRANTIATVVWSQFAGLILLLIVLPFLPAATVSSRDWIWGFVAGLSGGIGVAFLVSRAGGGHDGCCRAHHGGDRGDDSGAVRLCPGRTVAAADACRRRACADRHRPREPPADREVTAQSAIRKTGPFRPVSLCAFLAGLLVGIFFLSLARTRMAAGMWPLVAARISSIALFGAHRARDQTNACGWIRTATDCLCRRRPRYGGECSLHDRGPDWAAQHRRDARFSVSREHRSSRAPGFEGASQPVQIAGIACALVPS